MKQIHFNVLRRVPIFNMSQNGSPLTTPHQEKTYFQITFRIDLNVKANVYCKVPEMSKLFAIALAGHLRLVGQTA